MSASPQMWGTGPRTALFLSVSLSMWLPSCTGVETQEPVGTGLTAGSVGPGGSASGSGGTDGMTSDGSSDATSGTGATDSSGETAGTSSSTSGVSTSSSTTGVPTAGGTSGGPTTGTTGGEIPDNEYCAPVADWDPEWAEFEEEILVMVNEERALGADCGSYGVFGPADPMVMEPHLRCAARVHSKDMNDRDFFSHTNPDGEGPLDRMNRAEYPYSSWGENIAAGNAGPAATISQWMGSPGHCANIMDPMFNLLGVGYYPGGEWELWTQNFGRL